MRRWRVGTWSMGILLITLGIIMLVAQFKGISVVNRIIDWWPIILVMLGVEVLIHVFWARQEDSAIKYDVFSIFMIVLILLGSLSVYAVVNILGGIKGSDIFEDLKHYKYESTFQKQYTINGAAKEMLIVDNRNGNVHVEQGTGENVEVEAEITLRSNDEEYAKSMAGEIIEIKEEKEIRVTTRDGQQTGEGAKIRNIRVNYTIRVPEKINVEVTNRFGDTNLENIPQSVKVDSKNGKVVARGIGKELKVENSFGQIDIADIGGKAEINGNNNTITVKKVGNGINLENSFGSVTVEGITGNADITNGNGKTVLGHVDGNVSLHGKFGAIEVTDIKGNIAVENNNGELLMKDIEGNVEAGNKFGKISLINANKKVTLACNNGAVTYETDKVIEQDVRIDNAFGNVSIRFPKEQQGYVKAQTEFGGISNGVGLEEKKDGNSEKIDGMLGNGGINISVNNKNGGINIGNQ